MSILVLRDEKDVQHVSIDGKEYMLLCSGVMRRSVTVLVGRWINDRRALGKTYWKLSDFLNAYKKHGRILVEYVRKLAKNMDE